MNINFKSFTLVLFALSSALFIEAHDVSEAQIVFFESHRLPKNVIPIHYDIVLDFHHLLEDQTYRGKVGIDVKVIGRRSSYIKNRFKNLMRYFRRRQTEQCEFSKFSSNQIVVHRDKGVDITNVEYLVNKKNLQNQTRLVQLGILGYDYDPYFQMLAVNLKKPLKPGSIGRLNFDFKFKPRDDMRGVYERNYFHAGKQRHYIANQFQPSDARFVMPCFDEPEFKATFKLVIAHPKGEIALSNMPSINENPTNLILTTFKTTPMMSLHMVAFAVGDFEYTERVGQSEIPVRVYTVVGMTKAAEFALEVACKSLIWMENYTSIKYPLKRFDLVAIPDHGLDNYESWGLAFIRSNLTLLDEETRQVQKVTTAINVAHVVAHQWFANLITVSWWTDIWITEGIAAHKGFEIVEELFPELGSKYFARLDTLSSVLQADTSVLNRMNALIPDDRHMQTSDEILSVFNIRGYIRGASLFQLIKNDLGPDNFNLVLQKLLSVKKYANIDMSDLEDSINEVARRGPDYMARYSSQLNTISYPILTVSLAGLEEVLDDKSIKIVQNNVRSKFLSLSCEFANAFNMDQREVNDVVIGNYSRPTWFDLSNEAHWFKLNPEPDLSTYYRVRYDDQLIKKMKFAIQLKLMSPMDRLNLLDDATGLVTSHRLSPESLDKLLAFYSDEDHGAVILAMLKAYEVLSAIKGPDRFSSPALDSFLAIYERYGFTAPENMSVIDARAQEATLSALIRLNNRQVIDKALEKFDAHGGLIPELHLRAPIYEAVVLHGNEDQATLLKAHLFKTKSHDEQMRLISALLLLKKKIPKSQQIEPSKSGLIKGTERKIRLQIDAKKMESMIKSLFLNQVHTEKHGFRVFQNLRHGIEVF